MIRNECRSRARQEAELFRSLSPLPDGRGSMKVFVNGQ